jgi:hypothetical protein
MIEKPKKIVNIKCRANYQGSGSNDDPRNSCQGRQAEVIQTVDIENKIGYAGRLSMYRCTTCGGTFSIKA